jgi:hypothetical protein
VPTTPYRYVDPVTKDAATGVVAEVYARLSADCLTGADLVKTRWACLGGAPLSEALTSPVSALYSSLGTPASCASKLSRP